MLNMYFSEIKLQMYFTIICHLKLFIPDKVTLKVKQVISLSYSRETTQLACYEQPDEPQWVKNFFFLSSPS